MKKRGIKIAQIVKFLEGSLFITDDLYPEGGNLFVERPADLKGCGPGDLVWVRSFSEERLEMLEKGRPSLVICDRETSIRTTVPSISSDNPKVDFVRVMNEFFRSEERYFIDHSARVSPSAVLGVDVSIGAFARIGPEVEIGDGTVVKSGVCIVGETKIGKNCMIKPNTVIGEQGFNFVEHEGRIIHFPHVGRVVIEDDVWIGSCSTVELGTLGETRIRRGVKVDDLVQIGHNADIGERTGVAANSVVCGSVIGENCRLAPNCVINEKLRIGKNVTVGLGAVVIRDVEDGVTVAGVPAKPLKGKE